MKLPSKMPLAEVQIKGLPLRQAYWSVEVETVKGAVPYFVHIRNVYNSVSIVESKKAIYYEIYVTPSQQFTARGLEWGDRKGGVLLKFDKDNILSNETFEIKIPGSIRKDLPWLFEFIKDRLHEQLQKPFELSNTDLQQTPESALTVKARFIDQTALDVNALEAEYEAQFLLFLDNLLAPPGFDARRLNTVVVQEGKLHGVKSKHGAIKSLQRLFSDFMRKRVVGKKDLSDFPSLTDLWTRFQSEKPSDTFSFISTWMMGRFKELSKSGRQNELARLTVDATRFVQEVIVQGGFYDIEGASIAHITDTWLAAWNCKSISTLTAVLMGLWGAHYVSVVGVAQLADGRRFPYFIMENGLDMPPILLWWVIPWHFLTRGTRHNLRMSGLIS